MGTNYLNFWIDSCSVSSNNTLRLIGYVTYPDVNVENFQRKLSNVKILQAFQINKTTFKLLNIVEKTNEEGKFDIEISANKNSLFLLISKEGYNPTLAQFEER